MTATLLSQLDSGESTESEYSLQHLFMTMLDSLDADVYVSDLDSYEILYMNRHMRESFGCDLVGEICWEVFRGETGPCGHCTNPRLIGLDGKPGEVVVWEGKNPVTGKWYKNADRAIRWVDGRYVRMQIATDITELKEAEERLAYLATHDSLTGLPNRVLFQDRFQRAVARSTRAGGYVAILFLDLDGFKDINDDLGHRVGDLLLEVVAQRLQDCLRSGDTVARFSGDEFTFLLEALPRPSHAQVVAQKILDEVGAPIHLEGSFRTITASMGISVYPDDGEGMDVLLQKADAAMYHVKRRGKNGFRFIGDL